MKTQKSFSARLITSGRELEQLWALHCKFHDKLNRFIRLLVQVVDGKIGEDERTRDIYRRYVNFVLASDAKNAKYLFNGVSLPKWVSNTADKMKVEITEADGTAREMLGSEITPEVLGLLAEGKLMFDKKPLLKDLPRWAGEFIFNDAVAFLSGYRGQIANWESERTKWEREKTTWENENAAYLSVRSRLVEFQEANSVNLSRRRKRWHKYLEFLSAHPELSAWRGSEAVVHQLDTEAQEEIRQTPKTRQADVRAREFFRLNPELKALDAIHDEYERKFAPRRRKTGRNEYQETVGFKKKPGFTLPDPSNHPRWLNLNSEQTNPSAYGYLTLPPKAGKTGQIALKLLDAEGASYWHPFRFRGDARLSQLNFEIVKTEKKKRITKNSTEYTGAETDQAEETAAETSDKKNYSYFDRHTDAEVPAELKSARLRFSIDRSGKPYRAYLDFSVKRESLEVSDLARQVKFVPVKETSALAETGDQANEKVPKRMKIPDGITVAFIHAGISTAAYGVIATGSQDAPPVILDARKLWLSHLSEDGWTGEPKIKDILKHDRKLGRKASNRPQLAKGEAFAPNLRNHILKMEDDRYKKTCRRIIDYAINRENRRSSLTGEALPKADIIIIGDFFGVSQNAENNRMLNRLIRLWKRPKLIALLKDLSAEAGLRCYEMSSWGVSTVCSRCGQPGKRYLVTKKRGEREQEVKFDKAGRHFACASCGYRENAEKNAAFNLANIVFQGKGWLDGFKDFLQLTAKQKHRWHQETEEKLLSGASGLNNQI